VHGHWHCLSPSHLSSIRATTNPHLVGGARMTVSFNNSASGNNEPVELEVAGNWIDRYATISLGGQPVAEITRNFLNARQILGDADTVC
jgi:hypothetical protein